MAFKDLFIRKSKLSDEQYEMFQEYDEEYYMRRSDSAFVDEFGFQIIVFGLICLVGLVALGVWSLF